MGYSHYYYRPVKKDHDQETWDKFIKDCKYLYKHMPEHRVEEESYSDNPLWLNGCYAYKNPVFNKDKVYFNGASSKERVKEKDEKGRWYWKDINVDTFNNNLGHETFMLMRKARQQDIWNKKEKVLFDCCKTARKPYDLMVTACLTLYKYYFPYVEIHSDGEDEDWKESWNFIGTVLPHGSTIITELFMNGTIFGGELIWK